MEDSYNEISSNGEMIRAIPLQSGAKLFDQAYACGDGTIHAIEYDDVYRWNPDLG